MSKLKVLVLGVSGMLGSAIFRCLSVDTSMDVFGSVRDRTSVEKLFTKEIRHKLIGNIDIICEMDMLGLFAQVRPDVVINCIGIVKQLPSSKDHLQSIEINSRLPHRLARYCNAFDARLVHFSTDCVFSGQTGFYTEADNPDAYDLYGQTKSLGEINGPNNITLRTSIIGHELNSAKSLVDWFLGQSGTVRGYVNAVFSGLPTIEVARVLREHVIPDPMLSGTYHLSVDPINKFDLLQLVADTYRKKIVIEPDTSLNINRALNSEKFRRATNFKPQKWSDLIEQMHADYVRVFNKG